MKDRVVWTLVAALAVLVVVEQFASHHGPALPWHEVPGYRGLIGLGACVVVVLVSKWVGKHFLQRSEETHER